MIDSNEPQIKTPVMDRNVVQEGWVVPKKAPPKDGLEPEPRMKSPKETPVVKVTLDEGWGKSK